MATHFRLGPIAHEPRTFRGPLAEETSSEQVNQLYLHVL